ncbi:MAG: hypothetical protein CME06_12575 [Gemmatimonadetes bacterium]|nr:hypothetical protein [Gemmatimonadota bacterium]
MLSLGVVGTSRKENEQRVPIHPEHIRLIPAELRGAIAFEKGYAEPFGVHDRELTEIGFASATRSELLTDHDIVLLPKPVMEDFEELRAGRVLWGWPHCVQQRAFTQTAIDKRLTLIAFEAMFRWTREGVKDLHSFYKNNEMAGYCGVIHALGLAGMDGSYGPRRRATIISLGSVSRGAVYALQGRGFTDITVFTQRPSHLVKDQVLGCRYGQMSRGKPGEAHLMAVAPDGARCPFIEVLAESDIIVNGILQDTDRVLDFVTEDEIPLLKTDTLIIDISADDAMGFPFARPTSFEEPMFDVGSIHYYAVDHSPSHLWRAASWEVSTALLPFLPVVLRGPDGWDNDETIRRSIEIREGVIANPKILSFQKRSPDYPHPLTGSNETKQA